MNKIFKAICSIIIVISMLYALPTLAFASNSFELDIKNLITVQENGKKKIIKVSPDNFDKVQNSAFCLFDGSKNKERTLEKVVSELGFSFKCDEFEQLTKDLKLSHIESISVENTFIKINEFGVQEIIDEDEAMQIVLAAEENDELSLASDTGPTNNHSNEPVYSEDGCMMQSITVFYTPNYNGEGTTEGRYVIWGFCQWLTRPETQVVDAIALLSPDLRWVDKGNDMYNLIVTYTENTFNFETSGLDSESMAQTLDDGSVTTSVSHGAFFKYDLPGNKLLKTYTDISFWMTGVGFVHDPDNDKQYITVGLEYVHLKNKLSIDPTYSFAGSFDLSVSVVNMPEYYSSTHTWYYYDDYHA